MMAWMMAECIPSATSWVGVMLMSAKPAWARPSRYSVKDRAPVTLLWPVKVTRWLRSPAYYEGGQPMSALRLSRALVRAR